MAWKFAYEEPSGATHAEAHAEITTFSFNALNKTLTIGFSAWHNKAAKEAGKPQIAGWSATLQIGAAPTEVLKPVVNPNTNEIITPGKYIPSFDGLMADPTFKALYDALKAAAYSLSTDMKEFVSAVSVD